MTQQNDLKH